jgi:hypothetical protein
MFQCGHHMSAMQRARPKRSSAIRDENARLKKLAAELSLDKGMLQSVIRKNSLGS